MPKILVEYRFDRWEVIRRYGFHETLIAHRQSEEEANKIADQYRKVVD